MLLFNYQSECMVWYVFYYYDKFTRAIQEWLIYSMCWCFRPRIARLGHGQAVWWWRQTRPFLSQAWLTENDPWRQKVSSHRSSHHLHHHSQINQNVSMRHYLLEYLAISWRETFWFGGFQYKILNDTFINLRLPSVNQVLNIRC